MTPKNVEILKISSCILLTALCILFVYLDVSTNTDYPLVQASCVLLVLSACWWGWKSIAVPGMLASAFVLGNVFLSSGSNPVAVTVTALSFAAVWAAAAFARGKRIPAGEPVEMTENSGLQSGLFVKILNLIPISVAISRSENDEYVEINDMFLRLTGYKKDEIIGSNSAKLGLWIHPERSPREGLREGTRISGMPVRIRAKSGEIMDALYYAESIGTGRSRFVISAVTDVSDRARVEKALAESEERYRMIADAATDYIFKVRVDEHEGLVLEYTSENFPRITGRSTDEVRTLSSWSSVFHSEDMPKVNAFIARALSIGKPDEIECRTYTNKALRWISIIINPKKDGTGKVTSIFGAVKDINTRKLTEEALKHSEQLLSKINERFMFAAHSARFGIWDWYVEENKLVWDDMMYEIYDVSRDDFSGTYDGWISALHPDDRANADSSMRTVLEGSGKLESVFRIVKRNGEIRYVKTFGEVTRTTDGRSARMTGINFDITDLKRTEEALLESERNFRSIIENSTAGIALVSIDGRYLMVNPAFCEIFGYAAHDFLHSTFFDITHPDDIQYSREIMKSVLEGRGKNIRFNKRYVHNDGHTIWAEVSSAVMYYANREPSYFISHVTDITERKLSEERIKAGLEEKETLIHEIHHRVKNNLQAIISLLQMRREEIADEKTVGFLRELEEQARTMSLVYEQLYQSSSLARVDMGSYLRQLVMHVLEAFGSGRRIRTDIEVKPVELDIAYAMPCGLIVNELITNSLKHAFPEDFHEKPALTVSFAAEGQICTLSVRDNGKGIGRGFDASGGRTMGLRLVRLWATHQLGGSFDMSGDNGTSCTVRFEMHERKHNE